MAPVLTGKQIRAGLGWTNLTIDKLASKCGLNEKTIRRWTQDDGPIKAHQSNIDTVVDFFETRGCDVMSFGAKSSTVASVHLPPEMLDRLSKRYLNVKTLGEAARESRDYNVIVANLLKVSPRIATIYRQDDQLFFQSIKGDIPWASEQHSGTRVVDFPDPPLIQSDTSKNLVISAMI